MGSILEKFEGCPVIAAVKSDEELSRALQSNCQIVFILYGTICEAAALAQRCHDADKTVLIHVDLLAGLAQKPVAADFICAATCADGIISTQPAILRRAREVGLCTVLRMFLLDSKSLESAEKQVHAASPDLVEIMPGLMPRIISRIVGEISCPVITGGLVTEKDEVIQALAAGALCVSSSSETVWQMV